MRIYIYNGGLGLMGKSGVGQAILHQEALLEQAGIPTVACFIIKNIAIRYMDPVRCTMILSTESVFCAIVSWLLLREVMTPRMLLGAALIFAGVLMEVLRPAASRQAVKAAPQH